MSVPPSEPPRRDHASPADYESTPISRAEYISAIVHLYRGELFRANSWRLRLDNTTNWSILASGGLMTFAFGAPENTHWALLFGIGLVGWFLIIEARRFRLYYVWRSRLRMIEENFYGPILRRDPVSPDQDWGLLVAKDLFEPRFKIGRLSALRARLMRNYWAIFFVLLLAWFVKVSIHPMPARTFDDLRANLGENMLIPFWAPLVYVALVSLSLLYLALFVSRAGRGGDNEYWVEDRAPLGGLD